VLIVGEQQFHAAERVPEAADCVEPGREYEADAAGRDRLAVQSRCADERAQADGGPLVEHAEPESREDAILAAERRDIGDGREGDEIEVPQCE
jgi:hypothetical protein